MQHMLLRIKTEHNPQLNDEQYVIDVMDKLINDYPAVKGYFWERVGEHINLLIYGDITVARENGIRWNIGQ